MGIADSGMEGLLLSLCTTRNETMNFFPFENQERPSGRIRGRLQLFTGKVVMQVEVIFERRPSLIPPPPPGCKDTEAWECERAAWNTYRTYWRDATPDEMFPSRIASVHSEQPK